MRARPLACAGVPGQGLGAHSSVRGAGGAPRRGLPPLLLRPPHPLAFPLDISQAGLDKQGGM